MLPNAILSLSIIFGSISSLSAMEQKEIVIPTEENMCRTIKPLKELCVKKINGLINEGAYDDQQKELVDALASLQLPEKDNKKLAKAMILHQYSDYFKTWPHTLHKTLQGHTGSVRGLALDKKNNQLYSGSGDKTIKIWNLADKTCLQTLQGHTDSVRCLALDRKNNQLYSGSEDNSIKVWNYDAGIVLQFASFELIQLLHKIKNLINLTDQEKVLLNKLPESFKKQIIVQDKESKCCIS